MLDQTHNAPPGIQREMLRQMLLIRQFEEQAAQDHAQGRIYGAMHCYTGEEAVAVGVCSALTREDQIISTHRGHGHCIAKGADIARMFAELYGRQDGYCKGKGGSMHIADFDIGMLGANGIVAGGISILTGAGLAAKLERRNRVAVSFFGDGASNAGPFHECLNIAATMKLPVIYVCENNLYAANTPATQTHAMDSIAPRAAGYGIPGVVVDGNDVLEVNRATQAAIARARAGDGPTLIECRTYRWKGHSEKKSIPDFRDRDEIEGWKTRDPIRRLELSLRAQGELDDAGLQAMEDEVARAIAAAVAFAETSPMPSPDAVTEDMYAE